MSTQQSGLVAGNKQNSAGGITPKSRSTFPLSYSFFETERFAEYCPFYVQEAVSGDRLPLHSNHEVQTYNLKSPILQSLSKKKDYFAVPMQAILPLNWEKFYTNPNIGQDVPSNCGLGVADFWSKVKTMFSADLSILTTHLADSSLLPAQHVNETAHFLLFYEMFYSVGSLMETLGISGHNYFRAYDTVNSNNEVFFDDIVDKVFGLLQPSDTNVVYFHLNVGGKNYIVVANPSDYNASNRQEISLREALELMRDDLSFTIPLTGGADMTQAISDIKDYFDDLTFALPASDAPLNLGRLWAYQLVVAHFYSNDHVDFIYSADLYRQYIHELVTRGFSGNPHIVEMFSFSVNGFEYQYDSLSAFYCSNLLNYIASGILSIFSASAGSPNSLNDILAYFVSLLSFKRSLRFMDYFTGARSLPLAVGDHTVNVNANKVDVIDLAKSNMMTRFLQAVNRSGRKFSAYMQELFGVTPAYDYHNPMYLAHTSDLVGAQETENTGAAQMSQSLAVTSRLRATSSRYAFEYVPDRDSIVIGITYYDIPRVYARSTERQNFYLDRFDMFNPFMQFIGDQQIYEAEIGTDTPSIGTGFEFAYQNRNMEYKQRYNQCAGGFCLPSTGLDHWIFPADTLRRRLFHHISPSFIRSFNSELDRFYTSLSGYSLGTYFHFIVRYDNRMDATRPMAFAPTINP